MRPLILVCIMAVCVPVGAAFGNGQQPAAPNDTAVRAFIQQVEREWPGQAAQQALTVESLRLLGDAVESLASPQQKSAQEFMTVFARFRTETRRFESGTPDDIAQSANLQHAFITGVDLMRRLVGAKAEMEPAKTRLAALRRSADGIDRKQPLRRQPDVIERFFHQAAELLGNL